MQSKNRNGFKRIVVLMLVLVMVAGLLPVGIIAAPVAQKNAYLNGASVPNNGTVSAPAKVASGDEITYEIKVEKPNLDGNGQYDVLFVQDWSTSMVLGMSTFGTARNYAMNVSKQMAQYIYANYPNSRIAVMSYNGSMNCYNNADYFNVQYETAFVGASGYNSIFNITPYSNSPAIEDDNGQALRAAIDKMSGDTSTVYGSALPTNASKNFRQNYRVIPRDELDSGRTPVIILMSDFQNTEHASKYNNSGTGYWSSVLKNQADRFSTLYPKGILMTVRLDKTWYADDAKAFTPEYDNYMTTYLSPAGRSHWTFTKIAQTISPTNAFNAVKAAFTAAISVPMYTPMTVSDVIPNGLTILSTSPQATVSGQKVTWDLTTMPAEEHSLRVTAKVNDSPGEVSIDYNNTATVSIQGQADYTTNTTYHRLEKIVAAVNTGDAANITYNSAAITGNTYVGITDTINSVAVQYSTSPTMASSTRVTGVIGSPYTVNLTGLLPNTTYYYRADVNTAAGTVFGAIKSFTTGVQQSEMPVINAVYAGSDAITGNGIAGAVVTVTLPDGTIVNAVVNSGGRWTIDVPARIDLKIGEVVSAVQQEVGKLLSERAYTTVIEDPSVEPGIDLYVENMSTGLNSAKAGDILLYDVIVSNNGNPSSVWESAYVTFYLTGAARLQENTIRINNRTITSSQYDFDSAANTLTLYLGNIYGGGGFSISFRALVSSDIANIDQVVLDAELGSMPVIGASFFAGSSVQKSIIFRW